MNNNDQSYPAYLPWLVCISGSMFFFYEFIQMNMLNSIGQYLIKEFGMNATQLGLLGGWYFYANLIFIPIAGILLDRFSTRLILLCSMSLCVVGTILFSFSTSIYLAAFSRFLEGMGGGFCLLTAVRLASRWFDPRRMAFITGMAVTMAMLGGVVAQTPMTVLAEHLGWRQAVWLDASLGFLLIILMAVVVQDYPPGHQQRHEEEQVELKALGFWRAKKIAFGNWRNWLAGLFTCFLNQPISLLGALWGNMYLQSTYHISATDASYITSMIFLGTVFGSPAAGWISDKMGRRKLPMLLGNLMSLAIVLMIILVPNLSVIELVVMFLTLGFVSSAQVISYPLVAEMSPRILTATSVSVVSFTCVAGYPIFQPLFGKIMDLHWDGKMLNGAPVYAASDYHFAVWILPITFIAALGCLAFLKETYCKPVA